METLKKWLAKNGYTYESEVMTGGYQGIFVALEIIENYTVTGRIDTSKLMKYLSRYGYKWEYRGHYTSILITNV